MKTSKISLVSAVIFLHVIFATAVFAATDNVLSGNIKEADGGVSGQDTNSGSGVKTGHIQDGAITNSKMADGAITASKIGFYSNVIVVATSGVDGIKSFPDLASAMFSISDSSASNRYLIKIMPGTYSQYGQNSYLKPYVDIEGSGENLTTLIAMCRSIWPASESEIRNLTIDSSGPCLQSPLRLGGNATSLSNVTVKAINTSPNDTSYNTGIEMYGPAVLKNVTVITSGTGMSWGIFMSVSRQILSDVTVTSSGTGIYLMGGSESAILKNANISAVVGVMTDWNSSGSFAINNSVISGSVNTINNNSNTRVFIGSTQLDGGPVGGNIAGVICAGVYDENYVFYANTCP